MSATMQHFLADISSQIPPRSKYVCGLGLTTEIVPRSCVPRCPLSTHNQFMYQLHDVLLVLLAYCDVSCLHLSSTSVNREDSVQYALLHSILILLTPRANLRLPSLTRSRTRSRVLSLVYPWCFFRITCSVPCYVGCDSNTLNVPNHQVICWLLHSHDLHFFTEIRRVYPYYGRLPFHYVYVVNMHGNKQQGGSLVSFHKMSQLAVTYIECAYGPWVTFQQVNAPCHTARITTQYLQANNTNNVTWPSMSPDTSPIQHVWVMLNKMPMCGHWQYWESCPHPGLSHWHPFNTLWTRWEAGVWSALMPCFIIILHMDRVYVWNGNCL
jgi:hypothetical protein